MSSPPTLYAHSGEASIVDSTSELSRIGDRRWRARLEDHDRIVRAALGHWRGREIKTSGVRTGLHTGECEVREDDVAGIAVHIASRVMQEATSGEVLASSTVKDLVVGSGLRFADRGDHVLRGVPDSWRLYALER